MKTGSKNIILAHGDNTALVTVLHGAENIDVISYLGDGWGPNKYTFESLAFKSLDG